MKTIMVLLGFALLGVVGTMDRHDEEAVAEFKRDFVVVMDEQGEPQLVSLKEARETLALYDGFGGRERRHDATAVRYVPKPQGVRAVR